jgi:hypothetical protein
MDAIFNRSSFRTVDIFNLLRGVFFFAIFVWKESVKKEVKTRLRRYLLLCFHYYYYFQQYSFTRGAKKPSNKFSSEIVTDQKFTTSTFERNCAMILARELHDGDA